MKENLFDAKMFTLKNGLNLITIKKDSKLSTIHAGVKAGPLYEGAKEKGISHLLEHMLFKGTKNRSNEKLNFELEALGGEYNAYTDYGCTVYSATILSEELPDAIELFSDMLINSTFPEEEIVKEKGVILAEIRTSKDDVEELSFMKLNEIAFKKSALKESIAGDEKVISKLKREELLKFYNKFYTPNNTFIAITSPFEHEEMLAKVTEYFDIWERKETRIRKVIIEDNIPSRKITYKKDIESSTVCFLYTFHGLSEFEELALKILNHKLGSSNNSVLFRKLREDRGLAYDVYSDIDLTYAIKTLYIYTAVGENSIDEAIQIIQECIDDIVNGRPIFEESTISLMQKVLKTAVASTLEDSADLCNYVLHRAVEGLDIYGFEKDIENLQHITMDDLFNVAKKVFNNPTIHILLPEKGEDNGN